MRFRLLTGCVEDLDSLIVVYKRCRVPAVDQMERKAFFGAVWDMAVRLMGKQARQHPFWCLEDQRTKTWTRFFVELINEGVDVHRVCNFQVYYGFNHLPRPGTLLFHLTRSSDCHYIVGAALSHWVRILLVAEIDIAKYLQREEPSFPQYIDWLFPPCKARAWFTVAGTTKIEGFDVPLLHRYVDPYSKAYEVRNEFKNFGKLLKGHVWPDHGHLSTIKNTHCQQHVLWKSCEIDELEESEWPFVSNLVRDYEPSDPFPYWDYRHPDGNPPASFHYAQRLMQERFNRRQLKKLYRSGYLKREKRPLKIPGAWPDSAW
ncbi:uncharacterized protein CCOS01_02230 [Colletotrichum costaricense]|uniref:Uncharacterized protein n=1 Tax=Colletotrichum costaricense TaxID=1209916 RepID=A0AAI9Z7K6_9PEZI|nr:uncharacterized protein CCOS01_02230 [Colletotrichum costaricense]KAK1536910.1 hypothetical protein CCOS01_02230 [Colletotrichum costaricense]